MIIAISIKLKKSSHFWKKRCSSCSHCLPSWLWPSVQGSTTSHTSLWPIKLSRWLKRQCIKMLFAITSNTCPEMLVMYQLTKRLIQQERLQQMKLLLIPNLHLSQTLNPNTTSKVPNTVRSTSSPWPQMLTSRTRSTNSWRLEPEHSTLLQNSWEETPRYSSSPTFTRESTSQRSVRMESRSHFHQHDLENILTLNV